MEKIIDASMLRGFHVRGGDNYRWFDGKRYHSWCTCFDERDALDSAREYRERNKVLTKIVKVNRDESGRDYDTYMVFAHKTRATRGTRFV